MPPDGPRVSDGDIILPDPTTLDAEIHGVSELHPNSWARKTTNTHAMSLSAWFYGISVIRLVMGQWTAPGSPQVSPP